jgi:SanA protein
MFWFKRLLRIIVIISLFVGVNFVIQTYQKNESYKGYIYSDIGTIPSAPVALVFGAGLKNNGAPSDVLSDRVLSAVELYNAKKVQKILMSGDNGNKNYDEVTAMKKLAVEKGVPEKDIVLDYAGFDTYDTCYRARDIFDLRDVIAVSQEFHLPRVLYTCNELGVKAVGYSADKHEYVMAQAWKVREFLARMKAGLNIALESKPKFLGPKEKVFAE